MVVRAINQKDFRGRIFECLGGGQSAKAPAHYHNSWLSHLLLDFLQSFSSNTDKGEQCNRLAIRETLKGNENQQQISGSVQQMTNVEQEAKRNANVG